MFKNKSSVTDKGIILQRGFSAITTTAFILVMFIAPYGRGDSLKAGSIKGWGIMAIDSNALIGQFTAVAAGEYHSLALKSDGSIIAWGRNDFNQATPPEGNNFIAIATGAAYSLALKSDGSIVGWGRNDFNQATPPERNNFIAIAAGWDHSLALKSDGSIAGWGYNDHGQATPPEGNDYIAIAAGEYHSLALKSDGSIIGWGLNDAGQAKPPAGNDFIAIAAGGLHSLALKSDGSIVAWGYNYYGQATPPAGNDFIAVSAGAYHSLALKSDGSIVGWGNNYFGQLIIPAGNNFIAIAAAFGHSVALKSDGSIIAWGDNTYGQTKPPEGNDFIAIAAGEGHCLALKSDGSIVGWGWNYYGQATPPEGNDFIAIAAGSSHSHALKSDGSIVGWGWNYYGQATPPEGNNFIAIAAGGYYSLALKSDGSIVGWGDNDFGQATPPPGNDFIAIAPGLHHSLALKSDGSVVGWGWNYYGQAAPPEGNDFIAISAGWEYSLALKSDGSIIGWGTNYDWRGENWYGQATPPAGNDFVAIAAGEYHSLALKSDGSVVGWGLNDAGQATPPPGNDYIAIAAGAGQSLAIVSRCPLPRSPTGVSASDGTYTDHIQVTWNPVSEAIGYEVWRNITKLGEYTSPFDDYDVTAGITYYYRVKAKNSFGTSDFSSSDSGYAYSPPPATGNLQVTFSPAEAVSAGAQWYIDHAWQNSGATVTGLSVGSHMVFYKTIIGWTAPTSEQITISSGQTIQINRNYTQQIVNFSKFGSFDGQKNVKLTLRDCDGNNVTFSLSGNGYGLIDPCDCSFGRIELYDTTDKSVLTISTIGKTWTSIGSVICQGPLKGIAAKTSDLRGDITIAGSLGALTLRNVADNHTITIGFSSNPKAGVLMKFDQIKDLTINSDMPIKMLLATEWLDTDGTPDELNAPSVGSLIINGNKKMGLAGDFEADLNIGKSLGANLTEPVLKNAKIAGTLTGESVIHGNVGTATMNILQGWLNVEGDARSIKVNHALVTVDYPEDTGGKLIVDGMAGITAGKDKIKVQEGAELYSSQDANLYRFEDLRRYDQLGAWWTYNGTYTVKTSGENPYSDTTEMTTSVSGSTTNINGHDCYTIESYVGDQSVAMSWYTDTGGTHLAALDIISDYGVEFELDFDTTIIAPPYLRMKDTFEDTGSFTGDFSAFGDITGTIYEGVATASMTLLGHEEVTVPEDIGTTYLAAKIDTAVYLKGNMDIEYMGNIFPAKVTCSQKTTLWGVPGIGVVKSQLKDFSFVISIQGASAVTVKVKEVDELLDYGP